MKISIEFTNKKAIEDLIRKKGEIAKNNIVKRLKRIGEECVSVARNLPSPDATAAIKYVKGKRKAQIKKYNPHQPNYIDHTSNLRHSIGYLVAVDGVIQDSDFQNSDGEQTAKAALQKYQEGIVLILVAGMKYAYYVSKCGYDVLDSAIVEMKKKFQELVEFVNNV